MKILGRVNFLMSWSDQAGLVSGEFRLFKGQISPLFPLLTRITARFGADGTEFFVMLSGQRYACLRVLAQTNKRLLWSPVCGAGNYRSRPHFLRQRKRDIAF